MGAGVRAGHRRVSGLAGRKGPSTSGGQGGSSLVDQRLAGLQTGLAPALWAGWTPALI